VIIDTSALLAFFDQNEPRHTACAQVIESCTDELVVSPFVIAELGYLLATRLGVAAEVAALGELAGGAWELADFAAADLNSAVELIRRFDDQNVGLADASNVVLADRYRTRTIATLDQKRFNALRPLRGGRFTVVP
jgi:predicted nucleic acid-binding protein